MSRSIDELLPEKPDVRLRLYAWSSAEVAERWRGCLKVGQTTQLVNDRIRQSQGQARVEYSIEVDESAERADGSTISDTEVRAHLRSKGFESVVFESSREWMRCTAADVLTAIRELRENRDYSGTHHQDFSMRSEQMQAVEKTMDYFESVWAQNTEARPEFLWNAKMRFGKTFTAYQLARFMEAKRVLVVTFKPAVEDAWKTDLESHVDFDGWQYLSRATGANPAAADPDRPLVYFGSFQDLLGHDAAGNFKARHQWLTELTWDLVVFDEYHFGAWRDAAKELFEGEDEAANSRYLHTRSKSSAASKPPSFPSVQVPISTYRAHRSRLSQRGASSKSRSSIGPTLTSNAQKPSSLMSIPMSAIRMQRCLRCVSSRTRCLTSWSLWQTRASLMSLISARSSKQKEQRRRLPSSTKTMFRNGSTSSAVHTSRPR
jgi:hypothetical protein